jgi:hypothetical protein
MDKAALVNVELERGAELLDVLNRANVRVNVALWAHLSEYEDWRLIVSSRQFDSLDPRDAYRLLHDTLEMAGFGVRKTPPIMILPMSAPFIKDLRRIFGKAKSVEGMRLGGQMIGDRFIDDAYVYKIS